MATASQSILLPIEGEFPVDVELRIQPTVQRAAPTAAVGWKFRRRYTIANNADEPLANFPHAIDLGLTNGLVSIGQALSSGNDLRVWHQGREIARTLVDWNSGTFTTLCWIVIPYLGVGETMTVDVVYGNSAATTPPTLTAGEDLPAFDIQTAGANRSTNAKWVYKTERIAANAGKGGWYLTSGTAQPDVRHGVPGAWLPVNTLQSDDDRKQESYSTYVASGTKYHGRFEARRAVPGALLVGQDNGMDGVAIRLPIGITAVRSDIRWQNLAVGDTDTTPIGQVVIVTRNAPSEIWKTLYSNAALQATEATIATATYTPAAPVKEVAYAVWPQSGNNIDLSAKPDRYINASWYTTLEVHPTSGNVVTTAPSTVPWTPDDLGAKLLAWLDASAITGLTDGAAVATWTDSSGNGNDGAQGTAANRPTYQTNEQNSLPIVRFDGTNDTLQIADIPLATQPFAVVMAVKDVGTSSTGRFFSNDVGNILAIQSGVNGVDAILNSGTSLTYTTGGLTGSAFHLHVCYFNGASSYGTFDGTKSSVGNAGTNVDATQDIFIGAGVAGGSNFEAMDMGEFLVINAALTDGEVAIIEGYLAHKWGVTANLPGGHPYKTNAPTQVTHDEIYELATELRADGGGDAVAVPPYRSILLGNADSASGVGTPRLAAKLNEQVRIFSAERRIEVWNSGLTAKIEDAPIPGYRVVEGVLDENGDTVEQASLDWLSMMPQVNPLANPTYDANITGWSLVSVHANVTAAQSWDAAIFGAATGSHKTAISASTLGAGIGAYGVSPSDLLPIGNRQSEQVSAAFRVTDINLVPRLAIQWFDASQVFISQNIAATYVPPLTTWFRRCFAALVPEGAVYWKPLYYLIPDASNQIGDVHVDDWAINDTEIAILDVATGTLAWSAKWTPRYAYA